jgi:uncharacterized protein YjbJ (UPF0337 family)
MIPPDLAQEEVGMGLLDRLLGRGKKAAGETLDDPELRSEGVHQEQEGIAEASAEQHEEKAAEARERAAEHRVERESD